MYSNGAKYQGHFNNHKREGYGIVFYPSGKVEYDGFWKVSHLTHCGKPQCKLARDSTAQVTSQSSCCCGKAATPYLLLRQGRNTPCILLRQSRNTLCLLLRQSRSANWQETEEYEMDKRMGEGTNTSEDGSVTYKGDQSRSQQKVEGCCDSAASGDKGCCGSAATEDDEILGSAATGYKGVAAKPQQNTRGVVT